MKNNISLKSDTIKKIEKDYFASNIKVKEIIKKYNLDVKESELYKIIPPQKTNYICPHCDKNMYVHMSRTNKDIRFKTIFCIECNHINNDTRCICKNCNEKRETAQKEKFQQIEEIYNNRRSFGIDKLTLKDIVYVKILKHISPMSNVIAFPRKKEYQDEYERIVGELLEKNIINLSLDTSLEVIEEGDEGFFFNKADVYFESNIDEVLAEFDIEKYSNEEKKDLLADFIWDSLENNISELLDERNLVYDPTEVSINKFKELIFCEPYSNLKVYQFIVARWAFEAINVHGFQKSNVEKGIYTRLINLYEKNTAQGKRYRSDLKYVKGIIYVLITEILGKDIEILDVAINDMNL